MSTHRLNEVAAMLRGRKDHMDTDAASDVQPAATQIADLERTLATKELEVTKLREALVKMEQRLADNMDDRETVHALHAMVREVLSTPITTEALDSYVAEKVKEARVQQKPSGYFYEWDTELGVHRAFVAGSWNSRQPDRSIEYYLAPPLPAQPTEQPK